MVGHCRPVGSETLPYGPVAAAAVVVLAAAVSGAEQLLLLLGSISSAASAAAAANLSAMDGGGWGWRPAGEGGAKPIEACLRAEGRRIRPPCVFGLFEASNSEAGSIYFMPC